MAEPRAGGGLQVIFAIFLGLMVTAFIGVGVYTFYPSPDQALNTRIQDLMRQQQAIRNFRPEGALTQDDRDRLQVLTNQINTLQDRGSQGREAWGRTTSIVLIAFATLVMAISLIRADELPVISNGLLLGGVFTMVYGVGWIIATNTSVTRFVILTVALAITIGLGFVRFVRGHGRTAPMAASAPGSGEIVSLEQRLAALEKRMDDAANALGRR
jgi:hypothetical protein